MKLLYPGANQAFGTMNAMLEYVLGSKNMHSDSEPFAQSRNVNMHFDSTSVNIEKTLVGLRENYTRGQGKIHDIRENNLRDEGRPGDSVDMKMKWRDTDVSRRVVKSRSQLLYEGKTFDDESHDHRSSGGQERKINETNYYDIMPYNDNQMCSNDYQQNRKGNDDNTTHRYRICDTDVEIINHWNRRSSSDGHNSRTHHRCTSTSKKETSTPCQKGTGHERHRSRTATQLAEQKDRSDNQYVKRQHQSRSPISRQRRGTHRRERHRDDRQISTSISTRSCILHRPQSPAQCSDYSGSSLTRSSPGRGTSKRGHVPGNYLRYSLSPIQSLNQRDNRDYEHAYDKDHNSNRSHSKDRYQSNVEGGGWFEDKRDFRCSESQGKREKVNLRYDSKVQGCTLNDFSDISGSDEHIQWDKENCCNSSDEDSSVPEKKCRKKRSIDGGKDKHKKHTKMKCTSEKSIKRNKKTKGEKNRQSKSKQADEAGKKHRRRYQINKSTATLDNYNDSEVTENINEEENEVEEKIYNVQCLKSKHLKRKTTDKDRSRIDRGQSMKEILDERECYPDKQRKTKKLSHKRRHSSPTRAIKSKQRRFRSISRSCSPYTRRSLSPRRLRSRSRSRSRSQSRPRSWSRPRRAAQKTHILDELFQLILAPTPG